jgi:hypothetical protein
MLATDGRFIHSEGDSNWWIPSGRSFFSPNEADSPAQELAFAQQHFFLPHRTQDPFGNNSFVKFDAYSILPLHTVDALNNRTTAENTYRVMQPFRVTDPNGNRTEIAFDTLGLVVGTAVMGKVSETKGDSLGDFEANLTDQEQQDFLINPWPNRLNF